MRRSIDGSVVGQYDVRDEHITRLRLYKEGDEWMLDGTDASGFGYSTMCWSYDSHADAVSDLAEFARTFGNLGRV